jgi:hypothetical protein
MQSAVELAVASSYMSALLVPWIIAVPLGARIRNYCAV